MAELLAPLTELEAVNTILQNSSETGATTLEGTLDTDVQIARDYLTRISRQIQNRGWWFNRDYNKLVTPNASDEIEFPVNVTKADTDGQDKHKDYVLRGRRFYDRENHTYTITDPVYVTTVEILGFDELPESARVYITMAAARRFQADHIGDVNHEQFDAQDEQRAWAELVREDVKSQDANVLKDNVTSAATISRTHVYPRRY